MKGLCYALTISVVLAAVTASSPPAEATFAGPAYRSFGPTVRSIVGQAGQADVVLEAPASGRIGELIRFDLSKSTAESVKWLLVPTSADFETYNDGRNAVFSARRAGEYMFIIAVAQAGSVDVITHTVTIEGPPERPTKDSFVEWIPFWLYHLDLPKQQARDLAASFEGVSSRITAISTPKGIIEATSEANRSVLGPNIEVWKPFLVKVQAALAKRAASGSLSTPEQHKATWLEIAQGLRKYAQ